MGAVWMRARIELRRGWVSVLALALLVGLVGGAVLTAAAGARRTASSFDRFVEESGASDTFVELDDPDPGLVDEIERLPEVDALGRLAFVGAFPASGEYFPLLASVDGHVGATIDRPRVVAGRLADPEVPNEMTVSEATADRLDLGPGGRLTVKSYAADQTRGLESAEAPAGPDIELTVAGIVRLPGDLTAREDDPSISLLTPAFYETYRDRVAMLPGQFVVRLRDGPDALPEFRAAVRRVVGPDVAFTIDTAGLSFPQTVDDSLAVLSLGLWLFVAVAALAAVVALAVTLGRQAFGRAADDRTLAAMGLSRFQRFGAVFAPVVPAAIAGALIAVVLAVPASRFMPIGLARRAEPDPGVTIDATVLGLGLVGLLVVVVGLGAATAWRESSRATARTGVGSIHPSVVARGTTRSGLSPSMSTGVRMALEPGAGRTAVPVRPALAGAIAGVLGVVAVLVFGANLTRLVESPGRYGWGWDVNFSGVSPGVAAADPDVEAVADGRFQVPLAIDGGPEVGVGIEPVKGSIFTTVVTGRAPQNRDEIVLGAETLDRIGLSVGDRVEVTGPKRSRSMDIVGRGVFPSPDDPVALADGAALSGDGLRALGLAQGDPGERSYHQTLVRFAPGANMAAATARIADQARQCRDCPNQADVVTSAPSPEIDRLVQVRRLPALLAAFLALLAMLAVGYALVSAVSRRRRDLAVLETLGFTSRQVSATVVWQATTLAAIGLVVGIPAGIVVGRVSWTLVAEGLGVAADTRVPSAALLLVAIGALLVANLVAAVPARAAARIRPAAVLRSE